MCIPRSVKSKEIIWKYKEIIGKLYQEEDGWSVFGTILLCYQVHKPAGDPVHKPVGIDRKGTKRNSTHVISQLTHILKPNIPKPKKTTTEKALEHFKKII